MRRVGRAAAFAAIALTAAGLSSTPAGAAVVFGSGLSSTPNSFLCTSIMSPDPATCTYAISGLPTGLAAAGGARAPIDGVIVSWRVRSGEATEQPAMRLRVIHGETGGPGGPVQTIPKGEGIHTYSVRLPVQAGDRPGLDVLDSSSFGLAIGSGFEPDAIYSSWIPPLIEGHTRAPTVDEGAGVEILINATIEPDADRDGYGDESQDGCPTLVGPGGCPLIRPDTAIVRGPKGRIRTRMATFRFRSDPRGAEFECKLDRGPFKLCASPKRYKGLRVGRHKFKVRAFNSAGRDPIPATRTFRVEP
jgi:hypothetical protein